MIPKLGELSTQIEDSTTQAYQAEALEAVQEEHAPYFEALQKHPRLLVGTQVPRLDGEEGMETLRDVEDARSWQDAVKSILVDEVKDRATVSLEENADFLDTVHASIELFQNNADLIPGTREFDVELANQFATLAAPYEIRVDGRLQGYSIPVQPIIEQLRTRIHEGRAAPAAAQAAASGSGTAGAAAPGAAPPGAPAGDAAAPAGAPVDGPQAGVQSKAGSGTSTEDFSTLFGTIGLPNLQI